MYNRSMKSRKKLIIAALTVLALVVLWTGYVTWFNKDADKRTAEVVAIADQFKAPANWELMNNQINKPTVTGCIDITCPSVYRRWQFTPVEYANIEDFKNLVSKSGIDNIECKEDTLNGGKNLICERVLTKNGHRIDFSVYANNGSNVSEVVLRVE